MKAFLSHSGHDKELVARVFELLGPGQALYDSDAFRAGRSNVEWMERLLPATDLFVLFWSGHAVTAQGVAFELEALRTEVLQRGVGILIVSVDGESYRTLPAWLQQYYVEEISDPAVIARRILARLAPIRRGGGAARTFVNRRDELAEIERLLSAPVEEVPTALAICGWEGIGRRSLARQALLNVYPTAEGPYPTLALSAPEGPAEFFRKLVDLSERPSVARWQQLAQEFDGASRARQLELLAERTESFRSKGEVVFIVDDGGLVAENNKYHTWFSDFINALERDVRPAMILVQPRQTSAANQEAHPRIAYLRLSSLEDDHSQSLLGSLLKQHNIRYSRSQLEDLCRHIGGHPADLSQAAEFAQRRGLDALVRDKSAFRQATMKHAIGILARLDFGPSDFLVVNIVRDYRLMPVDDLLDLLGAPAVTSRMPLTTSEWLAVVERLEQYAVLERWGGYVRVAPFLVDAVARFLSSRPQELRDALDTVREPYSKAMLEITRRRSTQAGVSLASIESGLLASLRTNDEVQWIRQMVLPSHLLYLARECYDTRDYSKAARLVRDALDRKSSMTSDARSEANRLLAMSVIRMGRFPEADEPLAALDAIGSKTAFRNAHFVRGFRARVTGDFDRAEEQFRLSLGFDPKNFHTMREIAHVLLVQRRYADAESFARNAYGTAPTNPFVIDILCAILVGKPRSALSIQVDPELGGLLDELRYQDELQGTDFFASRMSQFLSAIGEGQQAVEMASRAVRDGERPSLGAHLALAERAIESRQFDLARRTLTDARRRAQDASRHDRSYWPRLLELEILLSIESGDLNGGIRMLRDNGTALPGALRARLGQIASRRMDGSTPTQFDVGLARWLTASIAERGDSLVDSPRVSTTRGNRGRSKVYSAMPVAVASLRKGQIVSARVIDHHTRHGVFVDVEGFKSLVPRKFVDRELEGTAPNDVVTCVVEVVEPERPALILRPAR